VAAHDLGAILDVDVKLGVVNQAAPPQLTVFPLRTRAASRYWDGLTLEQQVGV